MATSSLAVVVKFTVLVDVESVQAEAEVKHCAPHLCQAIPGRNMVDSEHTKRFSHPRAGLVSSPTHFGLGNMTRAGVEPVHTTDFGQTQLTVTPAL